MKKHTTTTIEVWEDSDEDPTERFGWGVRGPGRPGGDRRHHHRGRGLP